MDKQSLPSVEKFAAYLDGRLSPEEMQQFSQLAEHNATLRQLLEANSIIENTLSSLDENELQIPDEIINLDFDLPEIENVDFSPFDSDMNEDLDTIPIDDSNSNNELTDQNGMANHSFKQSFNVGEVIGTPGDEYHQTHPDTCAIKCQQIIINEFGIPCTEDQLIQFSYEHGWYYGNGTNPEDVGKLLEAANIPCKQQMNANVFNLVNELAQGHKVIVGVDSGELWHNDTPDGKFVNWIKDFYGNTPDHALIVAGIDTTDPDNIKVLVTDPGNGDHNKAYPIEQFMDAWSDSSCFMVSTEVSVPKIVEGMSNFDYYEGHISNVAGADFSDFQIFNNLSAGVPIFVNSNEGGLVSPMNSLVNAYMDFANNEVMFSDIFNGDTYDFNQYINIDEINESLANSLHEGMNQLDLQPELSWESYAMNNGLTQMTNDDYMDYLNSMMAVFNDSNDSQLTNFFEQQMMMLDYCNSHSLDFFDSIYNG